MVMVSGRESVSWSADEPCISYHTENHVSVVFQMRGSVWRRVLPFCIVNVVIAFVVGYFHAAKILNLSISDKGHTFLLIMVSFLIITRTQQAYQRYIEARKLLSETMKSCRELAQHTVTFSRYESSKKAKMWRSDIIRRICSLLRTVVLMLEEDTKHAHVWQVAELSKEEKQALLLSVGGSNERSPLVLAMFLRTSIASHVEMLSKPLDVNEELKLLDGVSEFVTAYHGLMRLLTTPFPFPLVQMNRMLLFAFVFTLPFALDGFIEQVIPLMFVVFFLTFGFIGLELVSMELDDPFGDDPNDFDVMGLAKVVFDDICIAIEDIDGEKAANSLMESVQLPLRDQIKMEVEQHSELSQLGFWGGAATKNNVDMASGKPLQPFASPSPSPLKPSRRSILLQQIRNHKSKEFIDVFGTGERVNYDSRSQSIRLKHEGKISSGDIRNIIDGNNADDNIRSTSGGDSYVDETPKSGELPGAGVSVLKAIKSEENVGKVPESDMSAKQVRWL